jgi:hypothetical protein
LGSKERFQLLSVEKDTIEGEMGEALIWDNPENSKSCRIYLRRTANIEDQSLWPEYREWFINKLETLYRVFSKRVKDLP